MACKFILRDKIHENPIFNNSYAMDGRYYMSHMVCVSSATQKLTRNMCQDQLKQH